ncbi:MAG TPA: DUF4112 domain-containing protein [Verrucomicrobiales bacterium]|nr:DUF4112 domain-containing protein [Verrucomicrobiales bacterium]
MPSEIPDRIIIDQVLPPSAKGMAARAAGESELARYLAKWLDNWLRIPGTDFKIGLDPILALIPGLGSGVASGGGVIILLEAIRSGVTLPVFIRMGGNLLLNTLFDFLPLGGPVASAFFKSNMRNLRLLQAWQAGNQAAVKKSTLRLFLSLGLLLAALAAMLIGLWIFYAWLISRVFQHLLA